MHNDEDDIIGDRPKRKAPTLFGLPLFESADVTAKDEAIGPPVINATGEPVGRLAGLTVLPDGSISAAVELNDAGRDLLDQLGANPQSEFDDDNPTGFPGDETMCGVCGEPFADGAPRAVADPSIGAVHPACARAAGWRVVAEEADDVAEGVWDAIVGAKPEAPAERPSSTVPTKAERLEAIERLKHKARRRVISLAESAIGAPEPLAGVTAADAFVIMTGEPEAALLGRDSRAWSWLGPWLSVLAREGALRVYRVKGHPVRRQSKRKQSHGNAHVVYLHPRDPRGYPVEDAR